MTRVEVQGESLLLLPERALFWERTGTLIAADVHLGKAASFRAAAIPLPGGTTTATLLRLSTALAHTGARRLLLLGDFFHAKSGRASRTLAAIADWRSRHADLEIVLIRGNHDRGAKRASWTRFGGWASNAVMFHRCAIIVAGTWYSPD